MKVFSALISACVVMIASSALALPSVPSGMTPIALTKPSSAYPAGAVYTRPNCTSSLKTCRLLRLRAEGLRMQHDDGGALTAEHRAYLQAKLDAIQAD